MRKSFKMLTLGMAGFVFSAQLAYADVAPGPVTAVPISAAISNHSTAIKIVNKEVKSESAELIVKMGIPVVSGMKDAKYEAQLNDSIERHAMEELDNAKKEAKEAADHAKAAGFTFRPYELIVKADVKADGGTSNADRISFTITTYLMTGGTGNPRVDTYNVLDNAEAKQVTLQDILGADYKAIVDQEVKTQIAANADKYFKDEFKGISETQSFYVQGNEVVVVFPKYAIAPGSTGTPEFRIALPNAVKPSSTVKLSSKEINTTSAELLVKMSIPVVEGMKDAKYEAQLNDIIERHAMEDLDNAKKNALDAADVAKKGGFEVRPYELIIKGELKSNGGAANADRVSLSIVTYLATGGTMGPRIDNYSFLDTAEAKRITLKDLLGDNYKAIVDKEVNDKINANPDQYFKGDFKGITETQSFYVEGDDVVIVFPKYAIAPGSTGTPEFRIALSPIDGGSNETKPAVPPIVLNADQSYKQDGFTMVPLRFVSERLGFNLTWHETTRSVELIQGDQVFTVFEGKDNILNKKDAVTLKGSAINKEGTMYVPLTFFTDILQAKATVGEQGQITIH